MALQTGACNQQVSRHQGRRGPRASGEAPPADAPLGIYAKTDSAPLGKSTKFVEAVDRETGEITSFSVEGETPKVVVTPQSARVERFALKSVVNRLLPKSRTSKCMRWRVPKQQTQVCKSIEHGKAFYTGLQVCASVWCCPVCAAKISERRRVELVSAVAIAKAKGWQVFLMTGTVPHGLGDDINAMLDQMLAAWRRTSTSRAGQSFRKLFQVEGMVRVLEVTDGQNGFHPHFHVLLFLSSDTTAKTVQNAFLPLWQDACVKEGLPRPSDAHGLQVDDGSKAAAYASKWGLESEMTKGHTKKSRDGNSPWDLLRHVLLNDDQAQRSGKRFRVYAEAFQGRRQLYWSNGLRAKLALNADQSDEELAHQEEDKAVVLAAITEDQWRAVLATGSEAALLNVAEVSPEEVGAFLGGCVLLASRQQKTNLLTEHL